MTRSTKYLRILYFSVLQKKSPNQKLVPAKAEIGLGIPLFYPEHKPLTVSLPSKIVGEYVQAGLLTPGSFYSPRLPIHHVCFSRTVDSGFVWFSSPVTAAGPCLKRLPYYPPAFFMPKAPTHSILSYIIQRTCQKKPLI